jgi:hypothetical protein
MYPQRYRGSELLERLDGHILISAEIRHDFLVLLWVFLVILLLMSGVHHRSILLVPFLEIAKTRSFSM